METLINKASNIVSGAELGRFPLSISIKNILHYILYVQSKDKNLSSRNLFMSFDLHRNGKSSFHSNLMHEDVRIF